MTILPGLLSGPCAVVRVFFKERKSHRSFLSNLSTNLRYTVTALAFVTITAVNPAAADNQSTNSARDAVIASFLQSGNEQKQRIAEQLQQGKGQWVELEGTVESYYEDHAENSRSRLRRFLVTPGGERIELELPNQAIIHGFGDQVTASGVLLESEEPELTYMLATTSNSVTSTDPSNTPITQTTGDQNTLVILVNFFDDTSEPFSHAQVNQAIFGDVNAYMYDNSFGQLSLHGDISGWHTLSLSSGTCDTNAIRDGANAAASNDGANLSAYQRIIYLFPKNACGFAGAASVGGSPSYVWLNGDISLRIAGHEVGHTLGLAHAHGLECGSTIVGDNCTSWEYADTLDIQGQRPGNFNTFNMELLGWFSSGDVQTASSSGQYDIEPYGAARNGLPKSIKVERGQNPDTGRREWFFIEYRTAVGYDSIIDEDSAFDSANLHNGVVIRIGEENSVNSGYMLDMTPGSDLIFDWFDPALESGLSFTDPESGITITTSSVSANSARIHVELSGNTPVCTTASPTVTLSALNGNSSASGGTLNYQLTVANQDSAECSSAIFDLSAMVPAGWSKSLSTSSLNLAPGSSGNTTLSVTAANNALDGAYVMQATGTQRTSGKSNTASATYTVVNPTNNTAPNAINDSASTPAKTSLNIPVLGNDSDPDGDALTVVSVTQPSNRGSVSINADGTVRYSPQRKFTGTESFYYTISDGINQATAKVTVTVSARDSSGGGGSTGGGGKGGGKGRNK